MRFTRSTLLVLALATAADATSSGANNATTTCGAGLSLLQCPAGPQAGDKCVAACETPAEFLPHACTSMATKTACWPCMGGYWCDGMYQHTCPLGMGSPRGSTDAGQCTCHRGHLQNASTCTVCPEGSWCDGDGEHSCPSGTTSRLASVAQEDCYCLGNYTGGLDCAGRDNATHHRCDAGYHFKGVEADPATGAGYDSCQWCASNYWCDGTDYSECPTGDMGVQFTYGKQSYADCFCPFGETTAVMMGPCVPCPPDGVQDVDTQLWTRGVNCAVTNMSAVTFTATLAVPLAEFNAQRAEYAAGVAQALWVAVGNVAVAEAAQTAAASGAGQRRLLLAPTATITVASTVTVPSADAAFVAAAATPANLARALAARSMTVSAVSAPAVEILPPAGSTPPPEEDEEDGDGDMLLLVALAVSGGVLLVLAALVWGFACRNNNNAHSSDAYARV